MTEVLPAASDMTRDERPGLRRLAVVELRKMTDTRAGAWLVAITALLTVAVAVGLTLAGSDADRDLKTSLDAAVTPASLLLPIIGILLVTSEWSQRTGMVTFALVPDRLRVVGAKLLAGLALAVVAFALCLVVALVATALGGADTGDRWSLSPGLIGQGALSLALAVLTGIGFGAVLLASAPAIVGFFVLPTAWSAVGTISALNGAARWLDPNRTASGLLEHHFSAIQWARLGTSSLLWMALPIAVGAWRILRSDIR